VGQKLLTLNILSNPPFSICQRERAKAPPRVEFARLLFKLCCTRMRTHNQGENVVSSCCLMPSWTYSL